MSAQSRKKNRLRRRRERRRQRNNEKWKAGLQLPALKTIRTWDLVSEIQSRSTFRIIADLRGGTVTPGAATASSALRPEEGPSYSSGSKT
jgi:hypothetical protein